MGKKARTPRKALVSKREVRNPWRSLVPKREPYKKVLIVCEGEKTEPNYFGGLKDYLKLSSANVEIVGEDDKLGNTPGKIVEYAKSRCKEEKGKGDPFDKVFCVFDQDEHTDYKNAIERCKQLKTFEATYSVPCFEYWLLLHYERTTRPYQKVGNKSVGDEVHSHLKQCLLKQGLPDYDKSNKDIFRDFQEKLEDAKKNAAWALERAESAGTDNPSTKVHILVSDLQNIKKH